MVNDQAGAPFCGGLARTFVLQKQCIAGGPLTLALPVLGLSTGLLWIGVRIWSVNDVALRQALTPADLLGRINATRRVVVHGLMPVGALLGGLLGTIFDLRMALVVGAAWYRELARRILRLPPTPEGDKPPRYILLFRPSRGCG